MTITEKLRSTHRMATLEDFHVGLRYQEAQPDAGGTRHTFIDREVKGDNFIQEARDYYMKVNNGIALVEDTQRVSSDYASAQAEIMADPKIQELLKVSEPKKKTKGK